MRILITGGTGFLGSRLTEELLREGHEVFMVTRQSADQLGQRPHRILTWPITEASDVALAQSCEVAINLAGESIGGKRWSKEQKLRLSRSRIEFTKELTDILRGSTQLKVFLSASGVGYYGSRNAEILNEDSPPGEGFLAQICKQWEAAASALQLPNLRTVLLRTGVVLGRGNGILKELEPLYQHWIGGPVGHGEQMLSWIHVDDWIRAVQFCLKNSAVAGPVNMVGPEPLSNRSFSYLMGELFHQRWQIPAPAVTLRLALGEMASLALESQNARPTKLQQLGFKFKFISAKTALWDIYEFEKNNHQVYDYFSTTTWMPKPLDKVFEFFSSEKNLEAMTPPELEFQVLKKSTSVMMQGTLIDYRLKVRGIPMKWRTLITDWKPPHFFSDQQVIGPYSYWLHTHRFESLAGGTLMKDEVHYRLPLYGFGRLFGHKLVKKDLKNIFNFRKRTLTSASF